MRLTRFSQMAARIINTRRVLGLAVGALVAFAPAATESAIANGDTRTISLFHAHTHESITATFKVDGQYDNAVLEKLNWFLRDWRRDEAIKMDPHLFDTVWEVYRESGSQQPIEVMSAYRSPQTNAMLRRRSRSVAEHSQHILGKAMDQHYMDVPMSRIRELGMRLQRGGVGFYPTAGTPFVHLDVGGVRHWPRMSYDQLARLFPDGKTVHIPSNGQPLPRYEEARAELEARGDGSYPTATEVKSKGFFAWLFGGGSDEDDDNAQAGIRSKTTRVASADPRPTGAPTGAVAVGTYGNRSTSAQSFFSADPPRVAFPSSPPPQAVAPPPVAAATAPPPAAAPQEPPLEAAPRPADAPPSPKQMLADAMATDPRAAQPGATPFTDASVAVRTAAVPEPLAPMPPRRPSELAFLEQAAPLPPSRPALSGAPAHDALRPASLPDAIGSLIASSAAGRLPALITQGPMAQGLVGTRRQIAALGYTAQSGLGDGGPVAATPAVPLPVARPANLLSPHLDRSNFRTLTRPDTTVRSVTRSAYGAIVPPVRAAARGNVEAFVPLPSARPSTFGNGQPGLSADRFSGSAGRTSAQNRAPTRTGVD